MIQLVLTLISGSSAFSKSSLNYWKFSVHIPLTSCFENFEHYFASMWDECSCAVFEHSLALPFFRIGMKTDLFQSSKIFFFKFSVYKICSSFAKFITKNFIVSDAFLNGIFFLRFGLFIAHVQTYNAFLYVALIFYQNDKLIY